MREKRVGGRGAHAQHDEHQLRAWTFFLLFCSGAVRLVGGVPGTPHSLTGFAQVWGIAAPSAGAHAFHGRMQPRGPRRQGMRVSAARGAVASPASSYSSGPAEVLQYRPEQEGSLTVHQIAEALRSCKHGSAMSAAVLCRARWWTCTGSCWATMMMRACEAMSWGSSRGTPRATKPLHWAVCPRARLLPVARQCLAGRGPRQHGKRVLPRLAAILAPCLTAAETTYVALRAHAGLVTTYRSSSIRQAQTGSGDLWRHATGRGPLL